LRNPHHDSARREVTTHMATLFSIIGSLFAFVLGDSVNWTG
jgi:hypothetical protein